jgi:restriction endonuclease
MEKLRQQQRDLEFNKKLDIAERLKVLAEDTNGTDADGMLIDLLTKIFDKKQQQQTGTEQQYNGVVFFGGSAAPQQTQIQNTNTSINPQVRQYSDEELRQLWEKVPANYKSQVNIVDDDKLFEILEDKLPDADDESLNRALEIVRGA